MNRKTRQDRLRAAAAALLVLPLSFAILAGCGGNSGEGNALTDPDYGDTAANGPDMDPTDSIGGTEGTTGDDSGMTEPEGADNSEGTEDAGDIDNTGEVPQ